MDAKTQVARLLRAAVAQAAPDAGEVAIVLERPRDAAHGDLACNIALQLGKRLRRNPRELAQAIVQALPKNELITSAEVAGAGFINFRLAKDA